MRPTLRLTDLRADELAELVCAVQRVGRVVERAYKADGLTIAYQVRYVTTALRHPLSCSFFFSFFFFFLLIFEGGSVTQDSVAAGQAVISSRGVYRAIASPGLEMTRFSINLRSRRGRSRSA